jgi:hypothetical protein
MSKTPCQIFKHKMKFRHPMNVVIHERFCSALPLIHMNTLVELMQTTNMVALIKFVACY